MTQPTHRAVLTGDIIHSSRLSPAQLASVRAGLTVCLQPFAEPGCPARAIRALSRRGRRGLVDPWTHARPGAGPLRHAKWDDIAGLAQEGRYLGRLELILVFLPVPIEQPNGIGFLIAAKSILRFGEIKEPGQRKVTEYIIIGTFISFGWALFSSVLTQKAIKF